MSAHNDGGPAFPQGGVWDGDRNQVNYACATLAERERRR